MCMLGSEGREVRRGKIRCYEKGGRGRRSRVREGAERRVEREGVK